MTLKTPQRQIYPVSQLNRTARALLEGQFQVVWVEGELSNIARPASGHWYFSLKDSSAQVRCAWFRTRNHYRRTPLNNGDQVLARGKLSLYEGRGDYQLIVEHVEPAGDGALKAAFEALKNQLQAQGLFAEERKQPLPVWPRAVGIITSPTGAAVRDVLAVLARRCPALPVRIYPCQVQGDQAATDIAKAIVTANEDGYADVLILCRGGGSMEDLWAFNETAVAHAVAASTLPVVSGVGHEVDVTIADYCADLRAATPSAAAELIAPDFTQATQQLLQLQNRLQRSWQARLQTQIVNLTHLQQRLQRQHPQDQLQQQAQRLDVAQLALQRLMQHQLGQQQHTLTNLQQRLQAQQPKNLISQHHKQLQQLTTALTRNILHQLQKNKTALAALGRELHAISPLATLERGYAIAKNEQQQVVRKIETIKTGDPLNVVVQNGLIQCQVLGTESSE